jgi:hypothetical protein
MARKIASKLFDTADGMVRDLWWFIENMSTDTPNVTECFFHLRERVREYYGQSSNVSVADSPSPELLRLAQEGLWDRDDVQFPRLLAEIASTVELTKDQLQAVCESMDLKEEDLSALFDRAELAWNKLKERYRASHP